MVHRLLEAVLAGPAAVAALPYTVSDVAAQADVCNDRKAASKEAQERSDLVYLCAYMYDVGGTCWTTCAVGPHLPVCEGHVCGMAARGARAGAHDTGVGFTWGN